MLKPLALLLLLISAAYATDIDFEVEGMACPETAGIIEVLLNLPACVTERFFSMLVDGFVYGAGEFLEHSLSFIIASPDMGLFCEPYGDVMAIIESLYTIAFMIVGAFYILKSSDVEGRATAKHWLKSIIMMILALSFSFNIFEMVLEINDYITASLYRESFETFLEIETTISSLVFAFILSFFYLNLAAVTFITLLLRYVMIPFLLLMFPVGIFLYFLPPAREWGAFLFRFILLIVFMTSVDALIVLAFSYLLEAGDPHLATGFVNGLVIMIGFGLIGLINSVIYIIATISVIIAAGKALTKAVSVGWKIALLASLL